MYTPLIVKISFGFFYFVKKNLYFLWKYLTDISVSLCYTHFSNFSGLGNIVINFITVGALKAKHLLSFLFVGSLQGVILKAFDVLVRDRWGNFLWISEQRLIFLSSKRNRIWWWIHVCMHLSETINLHTKKSEF